MSCGARHTTRSGFTLIEVVGALMIPPGSGWHWRGIVLAGSLEDVGREGFFTVEGMLVAGQGAPMGRLDLDAGQVLYHSCYASWAGFALAHLVPVTGN